MLYCSEYGVAVRRRCYSQSGPVCSPPSFPQARRLDARNKNNDIFYPASLYFDSTRDPCD